jgi:hypothetical protein
LEDFVEDIPTVPIQFSTPHDTGETLASLAYNGYHEHVAPGERFFAEICLGKKKGSV